MRNLKFFRYFTYSLLILLLFVLNSTPSLLPDIYGATPCLLLALGVSIAYFEAEVPAMIFGLVCGVLTDFGYSNSIGTFAVMMTIVCFIIGFCSNNLITANFTNVLLSATVIIAVILSLHFVFAFVIKGIDNSGIYFVNHYISRIVQTIICTVIFYFINKFVYSTLNE